jgi:hypothetical protein
MIEVTGNDGRASKYAITDNLDVIGAYYHYDQPAFGAPVNCADGAAFPNCHGTFDAVSFVIDWQFGKKFDEALVLTGQWRLGGRLPPSQHDRSHGWPSLPVLRNLQSAMSRSPTCRLAAVEAQIDLAFSTDLPANV